VTEPDLTPADGDTPGPYASPVQDADVRALLGTLRAEDVPMPDDVVRRINAAVVAERVASTLPDSPAALVDAEDGAVPAAAGTATVTVLPSAEERRGPSYAGLTKLLAVAAAVVVVVGVGAIIKNNGGLSTGASTSAGASSAPEDAAAGGGSSGKTVNATGLDYSATALAGQVRDLVAGTPQVATPVSGGDSSSGPTPQGSGTRSSAYTLADRGVLAACVTSLTGGTSVEPVVVDEGSYGGKPAQIVVLPTEGDPASLDVWVVAPGCGTGPEPTVLEFQRIARS
jgi:hypothetical protein